MDKRKLSLEKARTSRETELARTESNKLV